MSSVRVGDEGLIYENRKLAISGITGVLVASLIITSIVMAPWSIWDANLGSPSVPPGWLGGALSVRLFVSNLTEPIGVGSEGTLTVIVTSTLNASNVVVQFDMSQDSDSWPMGITFVGENLTTWSGDLRANVSMIFNARIRAVEPGLARLLVTLTWYPPEGGGVGVRDWLFILVQENDILVSHDPPPPQLEWNFLPMNPNATISLDDIY